MSCPIESFPESKKEFELIDNVKSNRGNKLKRGVEYIHRNDMAWTPEGFKPAGAEQTNKTDIKSDFKSNALKSVKSKEGKTNPQNLLNSQQTPSKSQELSISSLIDLKESSSFHSKALEAQRNYSIEFLTSTQSEKYCKDILKIVQEEFEWRKGLQKFCDFIKNKDWDEVNSRSSGGSGESNEFKLTKRKAIELAEEVNYNTSEFESFLKTSRQKLLKTLQNKDDYSSIVIQSGDIDKIKLLEINNNGKKLGLEGGKNSKSSKHGNKGKTKLSGTKPIHGNTKGNKPKTKQ